MVSEDGIITAAGKRDARDYGKISQQTFTCTVHVQEHCQKKRSRRWYREKTDAETALETYKNAEDYREAQKLELAQAIADGKAAIGSGGCRDGNAALAAAKAVLDKIKTDAQLTQKKKIRGR